MQVKIIPRNHSDQGQKKVRRQRPNRKWNPHGREATTLTEEEAANPQVSLQSHTAQRNKVLEAEEQGFCCKVAKQDMLPSTQVWRRIVAKIQYSPYNREHRGRSCRPRPKTRSVEQRRPRLHKGGPPNAEGGESGQAAQAQCLYRS